MCLYVLATLGMHVSRACVRVAWRLDAHRRSIQPSHARPGARAAHSCARGRTLRPGAASHIIRHWVNSLTESVHTVPHEIVAFAWWIECVVWWCLVAKQRLLCIVMMSRHQVGMCSHV